MDAFKNIFLWSFLVVILLFSSFQTYSLLSLSSRFNEAGLSVGKAKANYNFSSASGSLGELPDMAGGC